MVGQEGAEGERGGGRPADGVQQLQFGEQTVTTTFQGTNPRPVPGTSRYVVERVTLPSYATHYKVTVEYTVPSTHG